MFPGLFVVGVRGFLNLGPAEREAEAIAIPPPDLMPRLTARQRYGIAAYTNQNIRRTADAIRLMFWSE